MKTSIEKMYEAVERTNSRVCVGIDPSSGVIPNNFFYQEFVSEWFLNEKGMFDYCSCIINAIKNIVPAVKPNIAFFESIEMQDVFFEVCKYAQNKGLVVIADAKRADIGNTSKEYAKAFLGEDSPIDFLTINPYFGTDSVEPFISMANKNNKGLFVLVKTSNPSSKEIQDLMTQDGLTVYEQVALLVKKWGEKSLFSTNNLYNSIGAVVGATQKENAFKLREMLPNTWFLVPGYGAQGATAKDIVVNFDTSGFGAIVNASRSIIGAWKNEEHKDHSFSESITIEAIKMRDEINYEIECML